MISRRRLLAAALAALPAKLVAQDQGAARRYRIGILETTLAAANEENMAELRRGLKELGYVEGQNLELLYRTADGRGERFSALAAELARQNVDVIVTRGTPATLAAMKKTKGKVPIVAAAVADPVETRLVKSLEAPGGKVTGLTSNTNEVGPKRLELLKAVAPSTKIVAALVNRANPAAVAVWKAVEGAAPGLGLRLLALEVRRPEDMPAMLENAVLRGANALFVGIETFAAANRALIIELAARHRLPASYASREFVQAGGLMSYGVSYPNLYYRAAGYVDKVLKGADPGALAMERPNKFELAINRRTAFNLKLAIPPDLLLRSDKIVG